MKRMVVITLALLLLSIVLAGAGTAETSSQGEEQAFEDGWIPPGQENFKDTTFETIDQGAISYYGYGTGFTGGYKIIKDEEAWKDFWDEHKSAIFPTPDLPEVEFNKNMVLVALQGNKPTSGYAIGFTQVARHGNTVNAYVENA